MLLYIVVMATSYREVERAVTSANVVDTTLRTLPQFPIGPQDAEGNAQLTTKLETAGAFEVLRAWGVLPKTMQLAQILKGDEAVREQAELVAIVVSCTNRGIQRTSTAMLLRCVIPGFGGANNNDTDCLWNALSRSLAGYPGSAADFAKHTASRVGEGKLGGCPRRDTWDTLGLAVDWFGQARDEAGILRNLMLATGTIVYPGIDKTVEGTNNATAPAWWHFSQLHLRFLEEAISRIESDQGVKDAWSRVVLWRGPEQFFLIFTGLLLLLLLADRVRRRVVVGREAEAVLRILPEYLAQVRATREVDRPAAARDLADRLESADDHGRSIFVPPTAENAGARAESVVIYLAEKAVRRIVIEPREPELFRQTCDSISLAVERSGWLLRFASRALPAVGFIGTVRGIMVALPAAQNLFGTTGPQQIAALGGVIEPLGLAFATTLIALVVGLITGLLGDWEIAQEQGLLSRIEETLIDHIDPAEEPGSTRPATPPSPEPDKPGPISELEISPTTVKTRRRKKAVVKS